MRAICFLLSATLPIAVTGMTQAEIIRMQDGKVSRYRVGSGTLNIGSAKIRAEPMPVVTQPIPSVVEMMSAAMKATETGEPRLFLGGDGNGQQASSSSSPPLQYSPSEGGVGSQEYGTSSQPYTTSDLPAAYPKIVPYLRAGQLLTFRDGKFQFCSASLIKKGLLLTAARCVAQFGSNTYYTGFAYSPAPLNGNFGTTYDIKNTYVLTSWLDGSDPCTVPGQICRDDIAVATVDNQGVYPGTTTGWFSYAVNNYGYVNGQAEIAQLGYSFDMQVMKRTDSVAMKVPSLMNNSVIGSLLTDGSQGGPWVINLGIQPSLNGTSFGMQSTPNVVVGVTSWSGGVSSPAEKRAGASPFTSNNISVLVNSACSVEPDHC